MEGFFVGLMTGTSADGIDAALVKFHGEKCAILATHYHKYPLSLRKKILAVAEVSNDRLDEVATLDVMLGEMLAVATLSVIERAGLVPSQVHAIGSHGQTIRHRADWQKPFTVQIGDPNTIAAQTGVRVVSDFRRMDIAVGGQGAPLAPAFHHAMFESETEARVVLNLGGIANITILPTALSGEEVTGFDTGPANCLMDAWISAVKQAPFDECGDWAASGRVNQALLDQCLSDPYFSLAPPKSTGREYFNLTWLQAHLSQLKDDIPAEDVQTSLCELTCRSITRAIEKHAPRAQHLIICGGGANNHFLIQRLSEMLGAMRVETSRVCGIEPSWVEAAAFAWLARQRLCRKPGNLPSVTGAKRAVLLGGIYES
ncbi:MAG: anhydro-N-acetylmuramic acid kinase [Gammaproteobacteria bacterium]|nr:anhydro-N-acetylmuramic acid kinase [Gammaproteobacteria bacterium]